MNKATFIDFDDSFTFNLVQELILVGLEVNIINWMDFEKLPSDGLLVLGPGPGHPDDYQRIFPLIHEWLKDKRPFFGVCLGHQIFWTLSGAQILKSMIPKHGQKIEINLPKSWQAWLGTEKNPLWVQRYNSLKVPESISPASPQFENFSLDGEILITRGEKVITYQFHPESIGTSFRELWMRPVARDLV